MKKDEARILRGVAGVYLLSNPETKFRGQAVARGLFRKDGIKPLPGDIVRYESSKDPDIPWVITDISPRKNEIRRPPMANVDFLLLTASAELPKVDYHYLDRMICYALNNQIDVILLLTKCDLPEAKETIQEFTEYFKPSGFTCYFVSFADDKIIDVLREKLDHSLAAFAGQSGVGKSTLMNRILGQEILETGFLSEKAGRGRQTTRSVEIYSWHESFLADTPGFQSIEITNMNLEGRDLVLAYPELKAVSHLCRYADCRHMGEAGCAVEEANIHPDRLANYRSLRRDLDEFRRY